MKYTLSDVEGNETAFTDIKVLHDFINKPYQYWLSDAGDSAIQIRPGERIIFFKLRQGFFIMQHPDYMVPIIIKDRTALPILHYVGGEPFEVPDVCLCSVDKAFEIFKCYIEHDGKLDPSYKWVNICELPEHK